MFNNIERLNSAPINPMDKDKIVEISEYKLEQVNEEISTNTKIAVAAGLVVAASVAVTIVNPIPIAAVTLGFGAIILGIALLNIATAVMDTQSLQHNIQLCQ
jgi:hypothetical protein